MKLSALLAPLLDAKADHEMIRQMVVAYEQQQADAIDKRRKADAERQARKRDREAASRDVTLRHSDTPLVRDRMARVEDKSQTTEIEPQKENKTPRAALEAVLDAERAEAVLAHRQRIRKPLTAHAAKLLAGKFAQCPDPNAAADTMIGNGWQGFEPAWLAKPTARGSPAGRSDVRDVIHQLRSEIGAANGQSGPATGGDRQAALSLPASEFRRVG